MKTWLIAIAAICYALNCPASSHAQQASSQQMESAVASTLKEKNIPGAVVGIVRGGDVSYIQGYGLADVEEGTPLEADCLMPVGSVTKVLTATLLAVLVEEGAVAMDDPVAKHLPERVAVPDWTAKVTLRHLATHTSGLPREPNNRRDVPNSPSMMEPYSIEELYACVESVGLESTPGDKWAYSNLGYALLGHLLERASGKDYEALLKDKVLAPLKMPETGIYPTEVQAARIPKGYWPEDEQLIARPRWEFGEVAAFSGAISSGEDMCRLLAANLNAAVGGAETNTEWASILSAMHKPLAKISDQPPRAMSAGWFIDSLPGGLTAIGHGGEVDSFSCCIAFIPRLQLGIVVMANKGDDSAEALCRAVMPVVMSPGN